jgi:NodT family efflux transporter outer membrane factor (OMF) lipoprotein
MKIRLSILALALALSACAVGPDYQRPTAPVTARFKEAEGWKPADPKPAGSGTDWWSIYDDSVLDGLERRIDISNQTLKVSEAAWRQAEALADEARAGLFPVFSVSGTGTRSGGGSGGSTVSTGGVTYSTTGSGRGLNRFGASASASWDLDIWGKIRRTIEADVATAQASEADLAAARLSAEASLATDYFDLRVTDEEQQLLATTIDAYQRSLTITRNQYKAGIAAKADVITAETQLQAAQSQRIALGVTRAQYEHAIAVLVGAAPADVTIAPASLGSTIPVIPVDLPSTLLERRPDIAGAERRMASANAEIGIAVAAYYPDLSLSASYGVSAGALDSLFRASNALWSFGGTLGETVIDFGSRDAAVAAARAAWDGTVATYRQTVLTAFQQTEDNLSDLRILEQQNAVQQATVNLANEAVRLTLNEYKAGTVAYTSVVTAQTTALTQALTLLQIRQSRLTDSVALVQALGGGWNASDLHQPG